MTEDAPEDPRRLLERFEEHVEAFPESSFGWKEWRRRYFALQWRWVEAVRVREPLAHRFLEAAGLHLSERVAGLVVRLRDAVHAACGLLREHFEHESGEGKDGAALRAQWPRDGSRSLPPMNDGEIGVLDFVDSETRSICNWMLGRGPDGQPKQRGVGPSPKEVRERLLGWVAGDFLWWLVTLNGLSNYACGDAFLQAYYCGENTGLELEELLVDTAAAERWEAAYTLLVAYHHWKQRPDPTFGPAGQDWPATAWADGTARAVESWNWQPMLARDARRVLTFMERLTDWLLPERQIEPRVAQNDVVVVVDEDEKHPAVPMAVRLFYGWYERLRIERERVRRVMVQRTTVKVKTWERVEGRVVEHPRHGKVWYSQAEIEEQREQCGRKQRVGRFGRVLRRKDKVEDAGVWQWLRLWCVRASHRDVRTKAIAEFCDRFPKGGELQVAALDCQEYQEILNRALAICCDEIVKASRKHGVDLPWNEGDERAPEWQEELDRVSRVLRDRDSDQYDPDSVAAIQDHAELPPVPTAPVPEVLDQPLPASEVGKATALDAQEQEENLLRRAGKGWLVTFKGGPEMLSTNLGTTYIAELLRRPGRPVSYAELDAAKGAQPEASVVRAKDLDERGDACRIGAVESSRGEDVMDDRYKVEVKQRLKDLREDRAEAERDNDEAALERARAEHDALLEYVGGALGLRGEPRSLGDEATKRQQRITRAIRRAIAKMREHEHGKRLAAYLRNNISLGSAPTYTGEIRWSVVD